MKEKRPDLRVFTWIRPYLARWGMYRVLVVDDEKLEREGIRFLLSMEEGEWEIYEAANGKLALNELRKHPVDLMLTDIKMPHMDGLEATRLIRSYSKEVPIVALTAFAFESDKDRAIEAGCDDFLTKPVSQNALEKVLDKYVK
jgi:two-component system response regulator YesN